MKSLGDRFFRIALIIFLWSVKVAVAGIAIEYDELSLVTYQDGSEITGYYHARNDTFSCRFLFMADLNIGRKAEDGTSVLRMKTFDSPPHKNLFSYAQRDPRAEIGGTLYLHDDQLALKTDRPHGGCLTAAGFFGAEPGERGAAQYSVARRFDAIGIAVVNKKTFVYAKAGVGRRPQFLLPGDIVILISRQKAYAYVRFVDPDMSIDEGDAKKVTFGWLRDVDLTSPFPRSVTKELQRGRDADGHSHD